MILLFVKLLSPFSFVLALILGALIKQWWHVIPAGIAIAIAVEVMFTSTQHLRVFGEGLPAGITASMIHVALVFGVKRLVQSRKAKRALS